MLATSAGGSGRGRAKAVPAVPGGRGAPLRDVRGVHAHGVREAVCGVHGRGAGAETHRGAGRDHQAERSRGALRSLWEVARRTVGPEKTARDVGRYGGFFAEIGKTWGGIPDYPRFVTHFGAERLRRQRTQMRWMMEQRLVVVDPAVRGEDSERRQIMGYLDRLPDGSHGKVVMEEYHALLDGRVREGKLRRHSMRLGITPAVALLEAAEEAGRELPSQETLEAVLRRAPGQHAALPGFVPWLREKHGVALALPSKNGATSLRRRRESGRKEMLTRMGEEGGGHNVGVRWRTTALVYFHDGTLKRARTIPEEDVEAHMGGLRINIQVEGYWIPAPPRADEERGGR